MIQYGILPRPLRPLGWWNITRTTPPTPLSPRQYGGENYYTFIGYDFHPQGRRRVDLDSAVLVNVSAGWLEIARRFAAGRTPPRARRSSSVPTGRSSATRKITRCRSDAASLLPAAGRGLGSEKRAATDLVDGDRFIAYTRPRPDGLAVPLDRPLRQASPKGVRQLQLMAFLLLAGFLRGGARRPAGS